MNTNEHALKAARALQTKYWLGVHAAEEELTNVAEIITRTALEPATKELREALRNLMKAVTPELTGPTKNVPKSEWVRQWWAAEDVLAKYPAKEEQ